MPTFKIKREFAEIILGRDTMQRYGELNNSATAIFEKQPPVSKNAPWTLYDESVEILIKNGIPSDDAEFHTFLTVGFLLAATGCEVKDFQPGWDVFEEIIGCYGDEIKTVVDLAPANVWEHAKAVTKYFSVFPGKPMPWNRARIMGAVVGWISLDMAIASYLESVGGDAPICFEADSAGRSVLLH